MIKQKGTRWLYIRNFMFVALPAIITFFTKDEINFQVITGHFQIPRNINFIIRFSLGLLAVLLQVCIGWRIIRLSIKRDQLFKYSLNYLKVHKLVSLDKIGQAIKAEERNIIKEDRKIVRLQKKNLKCLDVKVYLPHRNPVNVCLEIISLGIIKSKTTFFENRIKEFGQQHETDLSFEVYPKTQGLIGKCFVEGSVCIAKDFNPNLKSLNLAAHQIDKLLDVKFYACCPVYLTRRKIAAILVFESRVPIQYDDRLNKLFHQKMREYRDQLELEFPIIFKKAEGE
ncbi:MAG: hypothetical protein ACM3YE_17320 [Bacteroidota bacterium]